MHSFEIWDDPHAAELLPVTAIVQTSFKTPWRIIPATVDLLKEAGHVTVAVMQMKFAEES